MGCKYMYDANRAANMHTMLAMMLPEVWCMCINTVQLFLQLDGLQVGDPCSTRQLKMHYSDFHRLLPIIGSFLSFYATVWNLQSEETPEQHFIYALLLRFCQRQQFIVSSLPQQTILRQVKRQQISQLTEFWQCLNYWLLYNSPMHVYSKVSPLVTYFW